MFAKDNDDEVAATQCVSSPVGLTSCFPRVNNVARAATHDPIHVAVKGNNYPIRKFVNHQCTTSSWPRDRRATHKKVTHELKGIKYEETAGALIMGKGNGTHTRFIVIYYYGPCKKDRDRLPHVSGL